MNFSGFDRWPEDTIVIVGEIYGAQEANKNSTARMSTDVLIFVISSASGFYLEETVRDSHPMFLVSIGAHALSFLGQIRLQRSRFLPGASEMKCGNRSRYGCE